MVQYLIWDICQNCVFESYLTSALSFYIINLFWKMMGSGVSYVSMRKRFTYSDFISYFDILMCQHFSFPRPNKLNFSLFLSDCQTNLAKGLLRLLGRMALVQNFIWIVRKHHLYASEEFAMKFGLPVDGIQSIRIFFFFLKFLIGNTIMQSIYNHTFFNKTLKM